MGRERMEMKRIESDSRRQSTFYKRSAGLTKKAHQLSVLCDAEVAFIMFSESGKLREFASSSMVQVLSRYNKYLETSENPGVEPDTENKNCDELAPIKEKLAQLQQKQKQLLDNDFNGWDINDLDQLEKLLNDGLSSVRNQLKEQMLKHQLEVQELPETHIAKTKAECKGEAMNVDPLTVLQLGQDKFVLPEAHNAKTKAECQGGAANVDPLTALQLGQDKFVLPEAHNAKTKAECQGGAANVDPLTALQLGPRREPEQGIAEKGPHLENSGSQIACNSWPGAFM